MTDHLRPAVAAKRFGVARSTLCAWADAGLISRARIGGVTFYDAGDIHDLIASDTVPRQVVPMVQSTAAETTDESWRNDPMWAGTVAAIPTLAVREVSR